MFDALLLGDQSAMTDNSVLMAYIGTAMFVSSTVYDMLLTTLKYRMILKVRTKVYQALLKRDWKFWLE